MCNNVVIVGRVNEFLRLDGCGDLVVKLDVKRDYKGEDGEYITDVIYCYMNNNAMIDNALAYCQPQDIIGIKGHLENKDNLKTVVMVDKFTFLASKDAE